MLRTANDVASSKLDGHVFDQDYIVREATDDLLSKVETREKLINNARDLAEKRKEDGHVSVIKNFELLMADFLHFYQPLLDRINKHETTIRQSVTELKSRLAGTKNMLQVTKSIEGASSKSEDLEREISHLEKSIESKNTTIDRIKKLFDKTKPYSNIESSSANESSDNEKPAHHRKRAD